MRGGIIFCGRVDFGSAHIVSPAGIEIPDARNRRRDDEGDDVPQLRRDRDHRRRQQAAASHERARRKDRPVRRRGRDIGLLQGIQRITTPAPALASRGATRDNRERHVPGGNHPRPYQRRH